MAFTFQIYPESNHFPPPSTVKPSSPLARICTTVSSLDPCLHPCLISHTPQFLLSNSRPSYPLKTRVRSCLSSAQNPPMLPILLRIKVKVLVVVSRVPFELAPLYPSLSLSNFLLPLSSLPQPLLALNMPDISLPQDLSTSHPIFQECSSSIYPHCLFPHPFSLCKFSPLSKAIPDHPI